MLSAIAQLETAPATEPLTLSEAKDHLRVDFSDKDSEITASIVGARLAVENETNRKLITQTWSIVFPAFTNTMVLPFAPLTSVTSVQYYDSSNVQQVLGTSVYEVNTSSMVGQIHLADNQVWPTTFRRHDAVKVTYVVGYADASSVPQQLKQAMLFTIGHWFDNTDSVVIGATPAEVPMAYKYLVSTYRVMW